MRLLKKYNRIVIYIVVGIFSLAITLYLAHLYLEEVNFNLRLSIVEPKSVVYKDTPMDTKIYFNNELKDDKYLDNIVDTINNAKSSIDIAMFSFSSRKIKEAIYKASDRGLKVTLILDSSRKLMKHDIFFQDLPKNITRIDVGFFDSKNIKNAEYMHHKLLIVDKGLGSQKMITGSINYTEKGELYEQSFYLVTADGDIIDAYSKEFDLLKHGFYGTKKIKNLEYNPWAKHIKYSDSYLDLWFSPGLSTNSSKQKIIESINSAKSDIKILMWQFTDKNIADALMKKAKEGINIKLIVDDLIAYKENSVIESLQQFKSEQKLDNFEILLDTKLNDLVDISKFRSDFSVFIHHHMMIVDGKTLVFGTNNWSISGFYRNDEDIIFTDNKYLIGEFQKTFDHFYEILKL